MNLQTIRYCITKILGYLSMKIGQFIFLFKRKKVYKINQLKKIVINRCDLIGDASLTKPLIKIFMEYLRKQGYSGSFTLLVSELNKSVFDDIDGKLEIVDERLKIHTRSIFAITRYKLSQGFSCFLMKIKNNKSNHSSLLIDFVGWRDMSILMKYFLEGYTSIVSCNLCFGSILLSNRIDTPFTTFQNDRNLMETYIDLIESTFEQKGEFRAYVYANIREFYPEYSLSNKSGILIFVGCKQERNFSVHKWTEIIHYFAKHFNGKITVIDDNLNAYYKPLSLIKFPNNVEVLQNIFSLRDFKSFASSFEWILGLDGGGMNYIRNVTNNITVYRLTDYHVWSPFVGKHTYIEQNLSNEWIIGKAVLDISGQKLHDVYIARTTFGLYEDIDVSKIYNSIFHK